MKFFNVLIVILLQSCFSKAQTFEGIWKGELAIQGQSLPLVFEIDKAGEVWKANMQSPAQSMVKLPVSSIQVKGDSIFLDVKNIGLSYRGLRKGSQINGKFKQGTIEAAMVLDKSQSGSDVKPLVRVQDVKPPYPYDTLDVSILNSYDNIKLAGTLSSPKGKGKYPAVVLLTGSGPQNRDEELFGHKPFKVLADYLTRNGIVVLRVDDRGVGLSEGDFSNATIENFSKDAISAFEFLRKQKQVDKSKVGIIGHSEGGLIAELLAGQHLSGLSFIGLLAGPSYSIDKMMVDQLYTIGKAGGISEQDLAKAKQINGRNFAIVKSDLGVKEAYAELLKNMKDAGIQSNQQLERELLTMLAPAYRYFMRIEPESYISKINIPVFAAFGTLDVQVPSDSNLESLFNLLPKNSQTVLKEYKGLNHLFQKAKTGQVSEYAQIEETMNLQVMKDIMEWIKGL